MNIAYYTQLYKPARKIWFYIRNFSSYLVPNAYMRWHGRRLIRSLSATELDSAMLRADYYCRLPKNCTLANQAIRIGDYHYPWHSRHKFVTYFFDLYRVVRCFPEDMRFLRLFGDVNKEQKEPTFVKSRPIVGNNETSMCVLLKLNQVRHFHFLHDSKLFRDKQNRIVFRNLVFENQPQRITFLERYFMHPMVDAGMVNEASGVNRPEWVRPYMGIGEQLSYKFVACIEGNDVATNLKWVMSSNSVAVMPRPRFETWFMEGMLRPDYHYIEVADDYHDLEEKLHYYIAHPEAAEAIISHAHDYIRTFLDKRQEAAVQWLTAQRYFERTGQQALLGTNYRIDR